MQQNITIIYYNLININPFTATASINYYILAGHFPGNALCIHVCILTTDTNYRGHFLSLKVDKNLYFFWRELKIIIENKSVFFI